MKNTWKIGKYFIFRCAGFPFELIEEIKFKNTFLAMDRFFEKQNDFNIQQLKEIFEDELYEKRLQLQKISSTQKFLEAVLHQNQIDHRNEINKCILNFSHQNIQKNKRNQHSKRKEQLIYRYLQRFCTKNDTVSFFGPFYFGSFDRIKEKILFKKENLDKIGCRKVYISTWLIEDILNKIIQDDEIFKMLKPRLIPMVYLKNNMALDLFSRKEVKLDKVCLKILRLIGRNYTIEEIYPKLKKYKINKKVIFDKIRWLIKKSILLSGLEISNKTDEPDEYLINKLSKISTAKNNQWLVKLKMLSEFKNKFKTADFISRASIISELKKLFLPLFSDSDFENVKLEKGFFTEYCESDIEKLNLGKEILRTLQRNLGFILNLLANNKIRINKVKKALLLNWLKVNFKNKEVRIKDVIYKIKEGMLKDNEPFIIADKNILDIEVEGFPSDFLDHIDQHKENKENRYINYNIKDLERQFDKYSGKLEEPAATCCDIFLCTQDVDAINKGDYKIVFGETHVMQKPLSIYKFLIETSSKRAYLVKEIENMQRIIGRRFTLAEFLTMPRSIRDKTYDFSTILDIEGSVYSQRKKEKITPSDLKLQWDDKSINLIATKRKKPILLLSPLLTLYKLFSVLSPENIARRFSETQTHFPRIQIDNFILQREQWVFLKSGLFFTEDSYSKSGIELWLELEEWRRKENVPRQFFLNIDGSAKPFFIDFENYFAIELFIYFSKKARKRLYISEMLPSPDELWLKDKNGRYTSEFRLTLYSD